MSHHSLNQWATKSPTNEPPHLQPMSRHISNQWATTSPNNELPQLQPMSSTSPDICLYISGCAWYWAPLWWHCPSSSSALSSSPSSPPPSRQCFGSVLIEPESGQKSQSRSRRLLNLDSSCFLALPGTNIPLFYNYKIFKSKQVNWKIYLMF